MLPLCCLIPFCLTWRYQGYAFLMLLSTFPVL